MHYWRYCTPFRLFLVLTAALVTQSTSTAPDFGVIGSSAPEAIRENPDQFRSAVSLNLFLRRSTTPPNSRISPCIDMWTPGQDYHPCQSSKTGNILSEPQMTSPKADCASHESLDAVIGLVQHYLTVFILQGMLERVHKVKSNSTGSRPSSGCSLT
jgi:hypothetical protein